VQGADNGELAGDVREWNGYINGQTAGNTFDTQFWGNYLYQKSLTGTGVSEERPWRFNIISNYEFQTGVLKNVNLGVSYRWQDKEVVGYPFANGTFETNHPYLSPVVDTWDGWVGYQRKLTNKIKWRIQLNVRNLFYSATLIPITVQPDGSPGEYVLIGEIWKDSNSMQSPADCPAGLFRYCFELHASTPAFPPSVRVCGFRPTGARVAGHRGRPLRTEGPNEPDVQFLRRGRSGQRRPSRRLAAAASPGARRMRLPLHPFPRAVLRRHGGVPGGQTGPIGL
jgi:hypothetical protein